MLLITHSIIGATIVSKIKNPFFSFPLIFILHFLTDFIPHWDLGSGYRKRSKVQNFFLAILDGLLGLILVFFIFQFQKPFSPTLWLGTGVSLLPDFLEFPYLFLGVHLFPSLDYFHSRIFHRKSQSVFWGLVPQIIIIIACLYLSITSSALFRDIRPFAYLF